MKKLSRKLHFIFMFAISMALGPASFGKYSKKQDADYVKEWCQANNGTPQKPLNKNLRPDCTTKKYVVEVDSVVEWKKNIEQTLRYKNATKLKAKFVAVIEYPEQEKYFKKAKSEIAKKKLNIEIEKLENFKSKEDSLADIDGPTVKMSNTKKCHVKACGSYGNTENVLGEFSTLAACLNSGGELPGNISEARIWKCELDANGKTSREEVKVSSKSDVADSKDPLNDESPAVKFSLSGQKCHKKGSRYYKQTKNFLPFKNLKDCRKGQKAYAQGDLLKWYREYLKGTNSAI